MDIMVRVPGSCGELVQGFAGGEPFLGTCPIDRYTTVQVSDRFFELDGLGEKSQQALRLALARLGRSSFPYGMRLTSELPRGKGMASSSADIAAVVVAVMEAFGKSWTPELIMDIAVQIEPTDGVFCPGIVLMNQVNGKIYAHFSQVPVLRGAVFDVGGMVDTCAFHQQENVAEDMCEMCNAFRQAIESGQAERIAQIATESALANQKALYKEELAQIWQLGQSAGAWGVNVAHSGTVLGLWWSADKDAAEIHACAERIARTAGVDYLGLVSLCSGGVEVRRR
jgi:L-threonine kinase